jgi:hypothetical protein
MLGLLMIQQGKSQLDAAVTAHNDGIISFRSRLPFAWIEEPAFEAPIHTVPGE